MNLIGGISLITAFFGGMVALFAPCCITFLLPSYLANIFREKTKVVWMTLLFGLGIASVLVPTALGIRAIGNLFDTYHTQTYVIGGIFMILLGAMELTGKKISLPMLNLTIDLNRRHDPFSVYLLGVFSGVTTSCCTPVLAGVLTVSFLSPSLFVAALAGFSYVAGMLLPLIVLALLLERVSWTRLPSVRNRTLQLGDKRILVTDAIAGILFILVGITFSLLALGGKIDIGMAKPVEMTLTPTLLSFVRFLRALPGSEVVFGVLLVLGVITVILKRRKS